MIVQKILTDHFNSTSLIKQKFVKSNIIFHLKIELKDINNLFYKKYRFKLILKHSINTINKIQKYQTFFVI